MGVYLQCNITKLKINTLADLLRKISTRGRVVNGPTRSGPNPKMQA